MTRTDLKMDAKAAMREAPVSPYLAAVITGSMSFLLYLGETFFKQWGKILFNDIHFDMIDLYQLCPFAFGVIIFEVISFIVSTIISFGFNCFCLKIAKRDSTTSYMDLFGSFNYLLKALGLSFMIGLLTTLWTLLLIIPGIIASCRYSQAIFIMIENPEKGVMQCIAESKSMMDGYKMDYFILGLSFILWIFPLIFTCGLAGIYLNPYMTTTFAYFYIDLKPKSLTYDESTAFE